MRDKYRDMLKSFYGKNKISCDNFDCVHFPDCSAKANGRPLSTGAEAYLGTKYGDPIKVLVLSLDTGGDSENLDDRTRTIESVVYEHANRHMKGTIDILLDLFSEYSFDEREVLRHFAMTNAAKCSANDGRKNKLPTDIYNSCRPYHIEEIKILNPDVIYAQGKDALPLGLYTQDQFLEDEIERFSKSQVENGRIQKSIRDGLLKHIFKAELGENQSAYLIKCPHPSDRGGRWHTFKDVLLPIINLFILERPGLKT